MTNGRNDETLRLKQELFRLATPVLLSSVSFFQGRDWFRKLISRREVSFHHNEGECFEM